MIIFPGLLGSIATVQTQAATIVTDGLILYLDCQNPSSYAGTGSDWYDLSPYSNTASLQNISFSTEEYDIKTFNFNGSNSVAIIPEYSASNTQTVSVEVWVRTSNLNQNGFFFEKGNVNTQYSLFQQGTSLIWRHFLNGGMSDLSIDSNILTGTQNFVQIVGTFSSGDRKIYVNGVQVASDSSAGTIGTDLNGISIGAYGGYNGSRGYYYTGSISTVLLYNKKLTQEEVTQNYNIFNNRFNGTIISIISGSSTFTSPDFTDSFEFEGNWNDAVDIITALSGSSTFTSPDFADSFEVSEGWT